MLLIVGILAAAVASASANQPTCAVGRLALRDLEAISGQEKGRRFYSGRSNQYRRDLLDVCPKLAKNLSPRFEMATDDVFLRVADIQSSTPLRIFYAAAPVIEEGAQRATVKMGYWCNGLCGAEYEATYVLTSGRWRRESAPRTTAVS